MNKVLTANRLDDGRVVFLSPTGDWSPDLNDACTVSDDDAAEELSAVGAIAEAACTIIGPYLIDVRQIGGRIQAAAIREAIRAAGPTVQPGLF
jgi:hypothetical protein